MKKAEILAPAGDFTCLKAAIDAGADAVYFGFGTFNIRARSASFKIEGRARNANYVKTVVAAYRKAVDAVADGIFTSELVATLTKQVKTVFHREFSDGMYFGRPGVNQFTDSEDSLATTVKRHIGIVIDYFLKAGYAQGPHGDCPHCPALKCPHRDCPRCPASPLPGVDHINSEGTVPLLRR